MTKRTAVIVGATGAIGRQLMALLIASPRFEKILVLHHRTTPYGGHARVEQLIVDFAAIPPPSAGDTIEAVFCCVGTTQKKAGSTEVFQRVDRDIPIALARWASANNASCFVGVSSVGARATARNVYLKTKGEMERGVAAEGVRSTYFLRPSLLTGGREEYRLAERFADGVLAVVEPIMLGPLRKYRAVHTKTVARAMLACADQHAPGVHIVESDVVEELGS